MKIEQKPRTENTVIIIFGATGDLTKRKLIPALYNLFKKDLLHKDVATILKNFEIPIHVRSTEAYPEKGTYILSNRSPQETISGIAYRDGYTNLTVSMIGLNETETWKIGRALSKNNISFEHIASEFDEFSYLIPNSEGPNEEALNRYTDFSDKHRARPAGKRRPGFTGRQQCRHPIQPHRFIRPNIQGGSAFIPQ